MADKYTLMKLDNQNHSDDGVGYIIYLTELGHINGEILRYLGDSKEVERKAKRILAFMNGKSNGDDVEYNKRMDDITKKLQRIQSAQGTLLSIGTKRSS